MEKATVAIHQVLTAFTEKENVADALIEFVKQLETDLAKSQDIVLFIFAMRSFFCWHRAEELALNKKEVGRVKELWMEQNDSAYSRWLSSREDQSEQLKWEKWTFQAKISLLAEFVAAQGLLKKGSAPVGS